MAALTINKQRRFVLLAAALGLLLGLAIAIGILKAHKAASGPRFLGSYTTNGFIQHPYLGYAPLANTKLSACKILAGDTLYCTQYTIDGQGRRALPHNPGALQHLLFFGCSFTYGEGVADNETFAARIAALCPTTQVHNYAYSGYGPQQMLAQLQFGHLGNGIEQPTGQLVYVLLPEHVYRAAGAPYYLQGWGSTSPHYALFGDSLVYYANHTAWRPIYTAWQRFLGWSGLGGLTTIAEPDYTTADIDLVVAIIEKSKQLYLQQFPQGEFWVFVPPFAGSIKLAALHNELLVALATAGIEVYNGQNIYPVVPPYIIIGDGHPSAEGHSKLAEVIHARMVCF